MTAVEHSKVEDHSTKQTSFAETEEESRCNEAIVSLDEAHAHSDCAPTNDEGRQVVSWLAVFQDQVGRDIYTNVGDVKHGQGNVKFIAGQMQVSDESINLCISNIAVPRSARVWQRLRRCFKPSVDKCQ